MLISESVDVVNRHGKKLMPRHLAKAGGLLEHGKAMPLENGEPFAIRLLYTAPAISNPLSRVSIANISL